MQECNTKILTHFSTSFFDPKWQKETYLFVNTFFSKHRAHRAWLARMDNFSASKLFLSVCPHENCKLTSANLQVILVVVFFFLFPRAERFLSSLRFVFLSLSRRPYHRLAIGWLLKAAKIFRARARKTFIPRDPF